MRIDCDIFGWYIGVNEIKCCTTLWNVFSQRFHCVGRLEKVHSRFLPFQPFPHFENFCRDLMARVSPFFSPFPHSQWSCIENLFFCQKIWRRHFWIPILSGHHTFSHICNHICNKNLQYNFPKMRGGSKAVWNFSENSSDFVARPFSYCPTALSKNTGCPRKKSTLKWWWWYH